MVCLVILSHACVSREVCMEKSCDAFCVGSRMQEKIPMVACHEIIIAYVNFAVGNFRRELVLIDNCLCCRRKWSWLCWW
jgi:hypothetical protein